jgi:hypothetical protein
MKTQEDLNNVIDIRTRQYILPKKVRSIIKGQYVESKDLGHDPDSFVNSLEQRILSELARTTIETTKSWLENQGFMGGK